MSKLKHWWQKSTRNEKLMYALILVLAIGIATRWRYVGDEISEAFTSLFNDEKKEKTTESRRPEISIPTVPAVITDQKEAAQWLAKHFWDKTTFTDTTLCKYPTVMEQAMAGWGQILLVADNDSLTHVEIKKILEKAAADSAVLRLVTQKMEWAFYDPNSQVRNFEAYIAAIEWMTQSDKLSDDERIRPQAHLEITSKNRKGTKANDIQFIEPNDKQNSLYNIKGDYTLLFFNNPGCPACREYKDFLEASPVVNNLITTNKLKVLGIYPDGEVDLWKESAIGFPENWINGCDSNKEIEATRSYELNVIPTLLLLDKNKVVLLKDARPQQVEEYLSQLIQQ